MKKEIICALALALAPAWRRIGAIDPMRHDNDLPTTDTTEIKQLIDRVKQGKLDQGDAQLIEKLLGFLLTLITLLQGNTTMRRLKKLLFGLKKRTSNKSQADKKDEKETQSPGSEQPTGDGTSKESASTGACKGGGGY